MAKYILTRGKFSVPDAKEETGRRAVSIGEAVELTKDQAAAFADFFEPSEVYEAKLKAVVAAAKHAASEVEKEASAPSKSTNPTPAGGK